MHDGVPYLPSILALLVYDTKLVHYLSMCCNVLKRVQKIQQVYDPKTEMVRDAHFLPLNINDSYNHNMNSVDLSDQLQNVYQIDHWMSKYKWW